MDRWVGKTAVVTGASAGIGAAIAVQLARAGMRVVGLARRPQRVQELQAQVSKGSVVGMQCDVSKPEEVAAAFRRVEEQFGGTDLLVNNAAVLLQGHITDIGSKSLPEESLLQTIDINVKGVVLCTRHAISSMNKRAVDGHIVNINSVSGHYVPSITVANVYSATKHAVTAFTTSLSDELAQLKCNIKTTSISPGLVATDMVSGDFGELVVEAPMLRPRHIADAVLYAVASPPDVNINELTLTAINQPRLPAPF